MKRPNQKRDPSEIPGLLADANKILRQNGLTLAQSGQTRFADNDAWQNPSTTTAAAEYDFDELMDRSSGTGGVELYFVKTITSPQSATTRGIKRAKGIAIAADGDALTVAHEVLHMFGLNDIYPRLSESVYLAETSASGLMPLDWGGGYYAPGIPHRFLVGRMMMSPQYQDQPPRGDVPSGPVWGWGVHATPNGITYEYEMVPVGQSDIGTFVPSE